jgi:hypothetical protein
MFMAADMINKRNGALNSFPLLFLKKGDHLAAFFIFACLPG